MNGNCFGVPVGKGAGVAGVESSSRGEGAAGSSAALAARASHVSSTRLSALHVTENAALG